ncbi:PPR repeat domain-containing protein [Naegleria gruberi]|uniref:PPR repeat domain-containing protein n=1 Tax=Naegleria gruberi TaxID=5762 RepID=D2UZM9_NAEGR|nr:PPR repeat domain-containing protein [Naegleria gruberi]EFC50187.1 PPR repeat domain-containing protein [Naegleria gruberi]|eukprot:XP_002682931.1 PPR repeat domain-containing protein [Naegleria gruberi strain NEG-M]
MSRRSSKLALCNHGVNCPHTIYKSSILDGRCYYHSAFTLNNSSSSLQQPTTINQKQEGFNQIEFDCLYHQYTNISENTHEFQSIEHLESDKLKNYLFSTKLYAMQVKEITSQLEEAFNNRDYKKVVDLFTHYYGDFEVKSREAYQRRIIPLTQYSMAIDSLINLENYKGGELLCYKCLHDEGLTSNHTIFSKLLKIYILSEQQKKFDELVKQLMDNNNLSIYHFGIILQEYSSRSDIKNLERIYSKIKEPTDYHHSIMLSSFIKTDQGMDKVNYAFRKISKPTTYQYNLLLNYYISKGSDKVEEIHSKIKEPDTYTQNIILKHYLNIGSTHKVISLLQHAKFDIVAYNTVMNSYAKKGDIKIVEDIYKMIQKPSHQSYNIILTAYQNAGLFEKVEEFYKHIPLEIRNDYSFSNQMQRYKSEKERLDKVKTIYDTIPSPNVVHKNILMDALADNADQKQTEKVFNSIESPDKYSYQALLKAFLKNNDLERAENLLKEIQNPTPAMYNLILNTYKEMGKIEKMRSLLKSIKHPADSTLTICLSALPPNEALSLLQKMPKPNDIHIRALMNNFINTGDINMVVQIFEKLINPSQEAFAILLKALSKTIKPNNSENLPVMEHYYQQMPDKRHTLANNSMLTALASVGDYERIRVIISEMSEPNIYSYNSLLRAYKMNGMYAQAHELFNQMEQVDSVSFVLIVACYYLSSHAHQANMSSELIESYFNKITKPTSSAYNSLVEYYIKEDTKESIMKAIALHKKNPAPDQNSFVKLKQAKEALEKLEKETNPTSK